VLERFWFLIDVIGFSFTVVNLKPSSFSSCAVADMHASASITAIKPFFMFLICFLLVFCCLFDVFVAKINRILKIFYFGGGFLDGCNTALSFKISCIIPE
jgi:hypothetical protein